MVITTTGVAGEKIIFDKLYVSETGTKIDLSLEIPTRQIFQGAVMSFRLMTAGFASNLGYNTYKRDQNRLKRDTFLKSIQANYIDIDFSFSSSALIRTTPGHFSESTSTYKLGTFDIQHTQEEFERRNIIAFCTRLADVSLGRLDGLEFILGSAFFPIKEGNIIYRPENPDVLVLQTALSGPTSLLSRAQEVGPAITEFKPTAFSQLFPSIKDDRFNFLYFLDLRQVLENNSDLFSLLSKNEQERAIESTIIKDQLFLKESNVKPTAPEFLNNALQASQVTGRTILNLPENVIAFTGGDEIREYSKNLKYNFNTSIIFLNGIYPVIEQLIDNIREIESFRSFMDDAFAKPVFYSRGTQTFYRNGLPTLREDLQREFNSSKAQDYPDRIDYFIKVMEEIIQATAKFDSIDLVLSVRFAIVELKKLISLDENANTNEYSFELFFRFFDSLVKELQQTFLGVGFQLSGAFSGSGKSGSSTNPEKTLIKVKHSFGYEFRPEDYSLRYSYMSGGPATNFPTITQGAYRLLMNENVRKYFTSDTPTRSPAIAGIENPGRYSVVPIMNYLTVRSVKKRNEVVFDNTRPGFYSEMSEIQGAKSSYLTALNIIKNKLLSINIERFEELSPESPALKARLYNAINEVYNLISFIPFPFVVDKSDDFRRETTDSILESAVSNDVLRPSEDENNEIVEAIYNLDENFENLGELNATIENRLGILTLFLDYVENLIEHPTNYDSLLLDTALRNSTQFLESIRSIKGSPTVSGDGSIISEIRLPYPLYSLYETFQTTPDQGRITFFWGGGQTVLQSALNSSFIRLNFANIKEIQTLTGFSTLENGKPNLSSPIFETIPPSESFEPNSALFCKMSNYNIGHLNTMWYLNSNNLLGLKGEAEHFFINSVEPGPRLTEVGDSIQLATIGNITQEQLEEAVENFEG
jgi:hypothetical protein